MSSELNCVSCNSNLENWNFGYEGMRHCPSCGIKLSKKQMILLRRKCSMEEIEDMIKERVFEALDNDNINVEELAHKAWESENCNGVVFYSNYLADKFVMRHSDWTDSALEYLEFQMGGDGYYSKMKSDCNDRFLVAAFIEATERFLYSDCEIDRNEGELSEERIEEIKEIIQSIGYSGEF